MFYTRPEPEKLETWVASFFSRSAAATSTAEERPAFEQKGGVTIEFAIKQADLISMGVTLRFRQLDEI